MSKTKSGVEAARETANKLRSEVATTKELDSVNMGGVSLPSEVSSFYKRNAGVGSENMARESLPSLKVVESNSKGELANGDRPTVGYLYYTGTKEQYKNTRVSIMSVSRGFYVKALNKGDRPKFQQIISGMLLDSMEPFIMYMGGKRLQNLWDLGKTLSPFTKHKESPVPMMAFQIDLSTTNYKHEFGDSHYIDFNLIKDGENRYQLITDISTLEVLEDGIATIKAVVADIIEATEVNKQTGELVKDTPTQLYSDAEDALMGIEEPGEAK